MTIFNFVIPEHLHEFRLDKAVSTLCTQGSRSLIQKAIKENHLKVNNSIISDLSYRVKSNDDIVLTLEMPQENKILPSNIPLDILYEDDDLIVLNKSSSMTSHPGAGEYKDTLVNALLYHTSNLSDIGGEIRPGIVHRLDKNTSGLMVVAKNNEAHTSLANQIEIRVLKRKYKALVWGMISPQNGIIKNQMARSKSDRTKMTTVKSGGKIAITHYKTVEILRSGAFSLIECQLETGRTHQIRVHLSHIGHSVVGDQTYGNNKRKIQGSDQSIRSELEKFDHQALHSFYISFIHPKNEQVMEFEKELPKDFSDLKTFLKG